MSLCDWVWYKWRLGKGICNAHTIPFNGLLWASTTLKGLPVSGVWNTMLAQISELTRIHAQPGLRGKRYRYEVPPSRAYFETWEGHRYPWDTQLRPALLSLSILCDRVLIGRVNLTQTWNYSRYSKCILTCILASTNRYITYVVLESRHCTLSCDTLVGYGMYQWYCST